MRRSPAIGNTASSILSVSLLPASHIRTRSPFLSRVRLSSALFLLSRSSTSRPRPLRLSFIFPCLRAVPRLLSFGFFFSRLPDHLPTPRVGVLFLSGRSSRPSARPRTHIYVRVLARLTRAHSYTRIHTNVRASRQVQEEEGEIKKGVKRELGYGRKRRVVGVHEKSGRWVV